MKAAHVYAARGWAVVPLHDVASGACSCPKRGECPSAGKHPRLNAWQNLATSDAETVAGWQAQFPTANVGIATGRASGFFALDIDPDKGGAETLRDLIELHGPLPQTVTAQTGSGGRHYLFTLPEGLDLRNSASKLGPGLDTRGDGGQIVVAPSRSARGVYRWLRAPWTTEIAEPPAWLVDLLSSAQTAIGVDAPPAERGYFPPAAPEVLEAARQALELHGPGPPRVNGEGGGLHAVQAGAILMHDFALTENEAWPLFVEWNQTRTPPFSEDDLRRRLQKGLKYGRAEYGKRRSQDALDRAKKLIADWRESGSGEKGMQKLREQIGPIVEACGSLLVRELIERDLKEATNLSARALDLPKPRHDIEPLPPKTVLVTPKVNEVADEATQHLEPLVFQRNGVLCEVVKNTSTWIHELESARIQDLMAKTASYVHRDEGETVEMAPPLQVAQILHARRDHAKVKPLEAITTAPIFLANGEILCKRGYNAQARVFLEPSVSVVVPDAPTQDDAQAAARVFRDLLCQFHFLEESDFSAWLAALLTPLVKSAIKNAPAPLFLFSAAKAGGGKSLLAEILSQIVMGGRMVARTYGGGKRADKNEWTKTLLSYVREAQPFIVFDDCSGTIGPDEELNKVITSSVYAGRILGASESPPLPNVSAWIATGNNIEPASDMVRRVAMTRIEVDVERPHERSGFKYDLNGERAGTPYALQNRSELLSQALTILRAYHLAGRPDQKLAGWASFEIWGALVREAIVWSGFPDPQLTQRRVTMNVDEPEDDANDFWLGVIDSCDGRAVSIAAMANQRDASTVLNMREQVTAFNLKKLVARFVDRPRAGKRIRRDGATYRVEIIPSG